MRNYAICFALGFLLTGCLGGTETTESEQNREVNQQNQESQPMVWGESDWGESVWQ